MFINHTIDPRAGGAEEVLRLLIERLPRYGVDVELACPFPTGADVPEGVVTYVLPAFHEGQSRAPGELLRMLISLLRINLALTRILRDHPDAIYANSIFALYFCAVPAWTLRIPLVYHEHGLVSQRRKSLWHALFSFLARRASVIVAISGAVARELHAIGIDSDRVRVVHNALSGEMPKQPPTRSGTNEPGRFRVAQIANLHEWKGHKTVLRAVGSAAKEGLDVSVSFYGREQVPEYAAELRDLAESLAVSDRLRFMGFVSNVRAELPGFDCAVVASDAEPFGLVILEGMSAGVPVIATASGGAAEIIEPGVTGLLFEPGNPEALASSWRQLSSDPSLADRLVKNAYERLLDRFHPDRQAIEIAGVIRGVVGD
jgi:glycosyltransferase involved in cell wall biosynthesis